MLVHEVARLWEEAKAAGVKITATGEHSIAAQKIEGSTNISGRGNVVQQGQNNFNISGNVTTTQSPQLQGSSHTHTLTPVQIHSNIWRKWSLKLVWGYPRHPIGVRL